MFQKVYFLKQGKESQGRLTEGRNKWAGYPSVDKPWLKYYSDVAAHTEIPKLTMCEFLLEQNKDREELTAFRYYGNDISYKVFFKNIERTATALTEHGIVAGDIVSILSLNTPETTYVIYALNYIGAVANLLIANTPASEICENIKKTESKLFFVLDKMLESLGDFESPVPIIILPIADSAKGAKKLLLQLTNSKVKKLETYKSFMCRISDYKAEMAGAFNDPAIIVYTSGTTGIPKGVVLSNYNINSCAVQCSISGKNYQPGELFLNILPPFFSFGIGMKHLCLCMGMTEIPMLIPRTNLVIKMIRKHRPNRLVIGPAFTDVIEKYQGDDLSFLIDLTGGGGSISLQTERKLNKVLFSKKSNSKYLSGYGMTELSAAVSMNYNENCKESSIGIPLPLTNIKICDPETELEFSYGKEGELLVNSPGLMLGYYKNDEETSKAIHITSDGERWIHTGDLAKIDIDGFVYITGRLKRIYIVTDDNNVAYKIFLQRMEETVQQITRVKECRAIVQKDDRHGYIPVVFVTIRDDSLQDEMTKTIYEKIKTELPIYYTPKNIIILDKMPVNANQKIDDHALENML